MLTRVKTLVGRNLAATVDDEVAAAGLIMGPIPQAPVTVDDIAGLPSTAQRYLRFSGVVGRARDLSFRAHFTGRFRMRPGLPWMPCEARQCNTSPQVSRIFHMRIDIGHVLPMVGRDTYIGGHGCMHGKLLGHTVVRGEGAEFDIGELTTYLNDAVLLAPSMLLTPAVTWSAVDDECFDITLTDADRTVAARVFVDERGAPRDFSSDDRYIALAGGPVQARWTTPIHDYGVVDGRLRTLRASAVWHLPNGPCEYARLVLAAGGIEYGGGPSAPLAPRREVEVAGRAT